VLDSDGAGIASAVIAPPPSARGIYEFASGVPLVSGPLAGSMLHPPAERAIDLWLQTLASRRYRWHVNIAPSQRGKTLTGVLIPMLHGLVEQRINVGWMMPSLDKLSQKWSGDLQPTIEAGLFQRYLPKKGPASKGGRPAAVVIRDPDTGARMSTLYAMALGKGGSETSTASNPCALALIDEADDAESAGQIRLAMKRTASYGAAGGGIVVSTINARQGRDMHPVLEIWQDTTRTRLAHLCPHCREYVVPDLEHFNVDQAAIACPGCGTLWSESDRHQARNNAEYRHANPDAEWFGVLHTALDYLWEYPDPATGKTELVLQALAREHRSAMAAKERGDPSQWANYLRKSWCRDDTQDDGEVPTTIDMVLAARTTKSTHVRGEIPNGAAVVTVGADVGKREAWWLSLGMDKDMRWWIVDWSVKTTADSRGEPNPDDQRDVLNRMRARALRVGRADAMGMDVGYNTDLVVPWAKENGFRCMRGDARPSGSKDDATPALPSWAQDRRQADGSRWLFIDGATAKAEIHRSLARNPGEPGAGHLPLGQEAGDWLIRHITAEVWDAKHGAWIKRPGRDNHLLDCLVYAWALAVIEIGKPPKTDQPIDIPLLHLGGLRF
jgi:phage terminase large subunit GpA-like protein